MWQSNNSEKGVTLVELLVTIFIIAIISGIFFVNYRQSNLQFLLQRTTTKLAQDIRRAQQMAMSAAVCCGGTVPPGYGIYFTPASTQSYLLYADINNSQDYTAGGDTVLETINLENSITITNSSTLSINFKPPDPIVNINVAGNHPSNSELDLRGGTTIKRVKFNIAGLIWVE